MRWFHLQRPICGDGCFLHHRVINYCSVLIIDLLIYWFPLLLLSSNSLQPINVTVTVGAYSLIVPDPNEQYIPALSMKPHENFNTSGFLNDDIGLIQVLLKLKLCPFFDYFLFEFRLIILMDGFNYRLIDYSIAVGSACGTRRPQCLVPPLRRREWHGQNSHRHGMGSYQRTSFHFVFHLRISFHSQLPINSFPPLINNDMIMDMKTGRRSSIRVSIASVIAVDRGECR